MLEIYNERLFDLFSKKRPEKGLDLRQHPKTGPFVAGQSFQLVSCYDDIKHWNEFGEKQRTIGATKMNQTSSRAHTIFALKLDKKDIGPPPKLTTSQI